MRSNERIDGFNEGSFDASTREVVREVLSWRRILESSLRSDCIAHVSSTRFDRLRSEQSTRRHVIVLAREYVYLLIGSLEY